MSKGAEILRRLRYRVIGQIHASRLEPGDRLPSIRQLARESGADHRAVARAYRLLEEEGVVEIRPDSGVYVAPVVGVPIPEEEEAKWVAEVLTEGWERGIPRDRVARLLAGCGSARPRCACVESNEDHMVALAAELEEGFALEVEPVLVDPHARMEAVAEALPVEAELVVTSVFHAAAAARAAVERGRLFVPLTFCPTFTSEIDRRLAGGAVTAVVADLRFAERGQAYLAVTAHRARVDYVLADRVEREKIDFEAPDVLVTRAARRRLGLPDYHLLPGHRLISPASARTLCGAIVHVAMQAQAG